MAPSDKSACADCREEMRQYRAIKPIKKNKSGRKFKHED
jgi:hypothetical protein